MSELKVASLFEFEKVLKGRSNKLFYSKSEADNVIAKLETRLSAIQSDKMQLEDDNALLRRNNAELREATRWRKCSDELPEDEERVLAVLNGEVRIVQYSRIEGVFHTLNFKLPKHSIEWWLPLPKLPEVQ